MTAERASLIGGIGWILASGVWFGLGNPTLAVIALMVAVLALQPLWRLTGRRVKGAVSAVEAAESDPTHRLARQHAEHNGGARPPRRGPET